MIEGLSQTVSVPLWLLLGLAGYHRVLQVGKRELRARRERKDRGSQ